MVDSPQKKSRALYKIGDPHKKSRDLHTKNRGDPNNLDQKLISNIILK